MQMRVGSTVPWVTLLCLSAGCPSQTTNGNPDLSVTSLVDMTSTGQPDMTPTGPLKMCQISCTDMGGCSAGRYCSASYCRRLECSNTSVCQTFYSSAHICSLVYRASVCVKPCQTDGECTAPETCSGLTDSGQRYCEFDVANRIGYSSNPQLNCSTTNMCPPIVGSPLVYDCVEQTRAEPRDLSVTD
jgi:hypothetical protein